MTGWGFLCPRQGHIHCGQKEALPRVGRPRGPNAPDALHPVYRLSGCGCQSFAAEIFPGSGTRTELTAHVNWTELFPKSAAQPQVRITEISFPHESKKKRQDNVHDAKYLVRKQRADMGALLPPQPPPPVICTGLPSGWVPGGTLRRRCG